MWLLRCEERVDGSSRAVREVWLLRCEELDGASRAVSEVWLLRYEELAGASRAVWEVWLLRCEELDGASRAVWEVWLLRCGEPVGKCVSSHWDEDTERRDGAPAVLEASVPARGRAEDSFLRVSILENWGREERSEALEASVPARERVDGSSRLEDWCREGSSENPSDTMLVRHMGQVSLSASQAARHFWPKM